MRVRIVFELKNKGGVVPFHHQHLIADLLKALLQGADDALSHYQLYNFSGLKGQTQVSKKGLHFYSNRITLVLSSQNEAFIRYVLDKIFSQSSLQIGDLWLRPEMVERELMPHFGNESKYLCISPLVLVSPEQQSSMAKRFVFPADDAFSDYIYDATMTRLEQSGLFSASQIASFYQFQVVPDAAYLSKIKQSSKKFARIYTIQDRNRKIELRGYTFPFTLYADPLVHQFIINCGLGAYTHRGYGMVDAVNSPVKRELMPEYSAKQSFDGTFVPRSSVKFDPDKNSY